MNPHFQHFKSRLFPKADSPNHQLQLTSISRISSVADSDICENKTFPPTLARKFNRSSVLALP
jgi:hypothetical protein